MSSLLKKSFQEHHKNAKEGLERMSAAKIKFNPKKCNLFCKDIKYLGPEEGTYNMPMLSPEDLVFKTTANIVTKWRPKKDCNLCNVALSKYYSRKVGN